MGWIGETIESFKSMKIRQALSQAVSFGLIVTSALMIWKALMCWTGSESPVVVVLSESMEPGFARGDILFLHMNKDPIRAGEIVVYNVEGRDIPIVHRVIKVHEKRDTGEDYILTKGDNNDFDDIVLYAEDQIWLQRQHIMGKAIGFLPYIGYATIIMTDMPIIKNLQNIRKRNRVAKRLTWSAYVHTYWCIGIAGLNFQGLRNKNFFTSNLYPIKRIGRVIHS